MGVEPGGRGICLVYEGRYKAENAKIRLGPIWALSKLKERHGIDAGTVGEG